VAELADLRNTYVVKKSEDRTRDQVARAILENGPLTAAELSSKLKLTAAGIRRHLDFLLEAGTLEAKEPFRLSNAVRGRGRPSKVFVLTDQGRADFEHSYDDLAVSALSFMASVSDRNLVQEFAESRAREIARLSRKDLEGETSHSKKIEKLSHFLNEEGYATTIKSTAIGVELCQHHCPIAHVASQFGELCETETEIFSHILGSHVQRLATIARGDGVCTTYIPHSPILSNNNQQTQQDHKNQQTQKLNTPTRDVME
jgi:predicted ArsR family transcriptional regulator